MVAISKLAVAIFASVALAGPVPDHGPITLFHELKEIPSAWTSKGAAHPTVMIRAQIGLNQPNIHVLQEELLDISNPKSRNYGNWLSKEEIHAITAPPKENIAAVKTWLQSNGIVDIDQPSPDWIELSVPVSKMESLLDTKYEMFHNKRYDTMIPRTSKFSVPKSLHGIIDLITPTTAFYQKMSAEIDDADTLIARNTNTVCDTTALTPGCVKQLYNVDHTPSNGIVSASTKFLSIQASHSDFKSFASQFVQGPVPDFQDVSVGGGKNYDNSTSLNTLREGNLDSQWAGGLNAPNPSQFLACSEGTASDHFKDEFTNLVTYLTTSDSPPSTVSTSYAGNEILFDFPYQDRACNEVMKATARGISLFFSSGDYGVGGEHQGSCSNGFAQNFPSVCPWATSVGGTDWNGDEEVVAQFQSFIYGKGSSGGGFSHYFKVPDYQANATAAYLQKLGTQYQGKFNPQGRGYPDVSLVASHYRVVIAGKVKSAHGTSASAPAWAGLIAVLNDYRKSQGKPALGFINPLVYDAGAAGLKDITSGSNGGCDSAGFPAEAGWDPATGMGTLNFAKFKTLV